MFLIKIYLILGLAMLLVALWDFKYLPNTANRLIRRQEDNVSGFSGIVLAVRNLMLMAFFAFFLWPAVVGMELFENKEK